MKKVININFQGSVIPIEESAYELLQEYTDSLRRYFAHEEGRDEIINDIESRISELFSERLKKGETCITDNDVNAIIASMGRPEDFDAEEEPSTAEGNPASGQAGEGYQSAFEPGAKRLYRDENHKILGGVCAGLGNYFGVDPVIIRIIAIICFSIAFLPYIILWVAVPSTATQTIGATRKRLFRNTDDKIIGGVCSGLAYYFGVNVWIPRLIFLIPFISFAFRFNHWMDWGWFGFPHFLSLSFSPAATITYIILWILVPEAVTTSDKLEMQGKPVDLNNIKDRIQSDLESFGSKAQKWGNDFSHKFKNEAKPTEAAAPVTPQPVRRRKSLGDVLILLIKIFAYFILAIILLTVVVSLFSVGVAFISVLPYKGFAIYDGWENILAWGTFFFFIWVPIIGIIVWIIRRISKSRRNSAAIRYSFMGLWILGWICLFGLLSMLGHDFSSSSHTDPQAVTLSNPGINKLVVMGTKPYEDLLDENDGFSNFLHYFNNDSVYIQNLHVRIEPSDDDSFHVFTTAYANGRSRNDARERAAKIFYPVTQSDSLLVVPNGFRVARSDKFRNQRMLLTISVPVGKHILIKDNVTWRNGIQVGFGRNGGWGIMSDDNNQDWDTNTEYMMTREGLKPVFPDLQDGDTDSDNSDSSVNKKTTPPSKQGAERIKVLEERRKALEKEEQELRREEEAKNNTSAVTKASNTIQLQMPSASTGYIGLGSVLLSKLGL